MTEEGHIPEFDDARIEHLRQRLDEAEAEMRARFASLREELEALEQASDESPTKRPFRRKSLGHGVSVAEKVSLLTSLHETNEEQPANDDASVRTARTGDAPPAASEPPKKSVSFEQLIGGRGAAWIGAFVVVLGAGYGIAHFGQGFWGSLSPAGKCWAIAGLGVLLVAGGEVVRKLVSRVASIGFYAAGIAVLYVDIQASYAAFNAPLMSPGMTLLMLGVVAMIGLALTWRSQLRSVGVFSQAAAFLIPMLLRDAGPLLVEHLSYLSALFVVGLILSAARPKLFEPVRLVSVGGLIIGASVWIGLFGQRHPIPTVVFVAAWWCMMLVQLVFSALAGRSQYQNAIIALLMSIWYFSIAAWLLDGATSPAQEWVGIHTAGIGVICAFVAMHFGPGLDALRKAPESAMSWLASCLWLLAGAFVVIAIGQQFDNLARPLSWAAFSIMCVEAGRRLPSRGVAITGIVSLVLASIDTFGVLSLSRPGLTLAFWSAGDFSASPIDFVVVALTASWAFAAVRWRIVPHKGVPAFAAVIFGALAILHWMILSSAMIDGLLVPTAWIVAAAGLILAMPRIEQCRPHLLIIGLLACVAARLVFFDGMVRATSPDVASIEPAFWNLHLVNAMLCVATAACALVRATRAHLWMKFAAAARSIVIHSGALLLGVIVCMETSVAIQARELVTGPDAHWPLWLELVLWFCMIAGVTGTITAGVGYRLRDVAGVIGGFIGFEAAALAWIVGGASLARFYVGTIDTGLMLNLQAMSGLALAVLSLVHLRFKQCEQIDVSSRRAMALAAPMAFVVLLLIVGSLEIDRAFIGNAEHTHTGLSIYWALTAVVLIVYGFALRKSAARWGGLALMGITLGKFFIIDLAEVDLVYRFLSGIVVGLLLIGTSVLYARVAQREDGAEEDVDELEAEDSDEDSGRIETVGDEESAI